jgi:hypothetical protein
MQDIDEEQLMYSIADPSITKMAIDERIHNRPPIGFRRSARLISIEIRRSRQAGHSK